MTITFTWNDGTETVTLNTESAVKVAEMARELEAIEDIVRRNEWISEN